MHYTRCISLSVQVIAMSVSLMGLIILSMCLRFFTEYITALTMVLSPGITATDFSALNTRKVRRAEKLPRSIAIVT